MPRQERARVTRDTILRAAAEEFEQFGRIAGSLRNVLARSGVTKGAFYFHFDSKDAVVAELIKAQQGCGPAVYRQWAQRSADPLTRFVGTLQELAERAAADVVLRAGFRLAAECDQAEAEPPPFAWWEEAFTDWLGQAAEAGQLRPEVDVPATARSLHAMFVGARIVSFTLSGCDDYAQRVTQTLDLVLPCIATDEWITDWRKRRALGTPSPGGPL